jgi:GxxExxY protein
MHSAHVNRVSGAVVDSAFAVHTVLGPGLLESAYQACLAHELSKRGFVVQREVALPVVYDGLKLEAGYRIDLLVENCIVVEVKSVEALAPIHKAQLLSYLKLSGNPLGLLLNFNVVRMKEGIVRMIHS